MTARLNLHLPSPAATSGLLVSGLGLLLGVAAGIDPALALVAAFGLVFTAAVIADLTAGLLLFVVLLYLESLLPGGGALTLTKFSGLLIGVSWLARMSTRSGEQNFLTAHRGISYLLIAFLGWAALSLSWATDSAAGLEDLSRYALNIVLYLIVFSAVREERHVLWIFWAIVAGTAATAVLGFVVGSAEANPADDRLASTVGNANQLAAVLVAGLAITAGMAFASRGNPGRRIAAVAIVVPALFALAMTGSRSGVIALGLALLALPILAGRWRWQAFVAVLAAAIATVTLFLAFAPEPVRERVTEITPGEVRASQEGRVTIWAAAEGMVADNFLKGVGVGNFQARSADYVLEPGTGGRGDQVIDDPQVAHNTYLHVLAELGIVGAIAFLAIILFSVAAAYVAARTFERSRNERMEILARALVVAMIGILVADFFASEQFSKLLWLLLGLGPALLAIARRSQVGEETSRFDDRSARPT